MAGKYDFEIKQGTTFTKLLKKKDSEGTYINFTGYTAKMQIRKFSKAGDLAIELSTVNQKITIDGTNITLNLTATETSALTGNLHYYDIELTKDSKVERLLEGTITINTEVTK